MGISVADNFSYLGGKPLDGRIQYSTLAAMKAMTDATLYEGCEAYCVETDKYYNWKSSNTVDADTGKWREVEGGGGQTYNDFTGATASTAGAHGLVPAPSAGDEGKVLFGNGAWGNIVMPSVDYSVLSDESNILSMTEKAVGTTTDNHLIWQKVVSTGGSVPSGTTLLQRVALLNSTDIIRYTKNGESALAADEKYAGVTSSGDIIYKRTWVLNTPLPGSNDNPKYINIPLTGLSSIPIDLLLKHDIAVKGVGEDNAGKYLDGNSTKLTSTIFPTNSVAEVFQTQTSVTGGFVVKEITLYYTKSS